MLKRISLFFTICVLFFSFLSCNKKTANNETEQEKQITLVMAEVNPPETLAGRTDQAFKEKVEELSGGKIKIDLQCSGILGDNSAVRKIIMQANSSIQLCRQSTSSLISFGCKKSALLSIPFTFSSREHFWNFANSEVAHEILNEPKEKGLNIIGLYYGEEGFRHLFSTKAISSIQDCAGLTMRTTNDKALQAIASSLKMEQKQVNFSDLYGALLTGQVDVADQPLSNYMANKFNEVAPHIILDGHMLGIMETFITTEAWDSLSEKQQNILSEAGKYASEYCRKISAEEEDKILKEIEKAGVSVVKVDDKTPYQEACADFIKQTAADNQELYQKILDLAKNGN